MNFKKQTHISLSFYHSLVLPKMLQSQAKLSNIRGVTNSWDILQFELKKLLDLDLKKLGVPYWNQINLIICWPWTWKTLQLPYCTRIDFMIYWTLTWKKHGLLGFGLIFIAEKVSMFGVNLVRIFPHSDCIWRDTKYLSIFSPNSGKCGLE